MDNDNVEELSNEEITEIMRSINNEQLRKIGIMSIYDSFYGSLESMKLVEKSKIIEKIESKEEQEKLYSHYNSLLKLVYDLDDSIKNQEDNLEKIKNIRKDLYKLSNYLKPYIIEISYINELANNYFNKHMVEDKQDFGKLDQEILNKLYLDITNYIAKDSKDYYLFSKKISAIIRILPFRMTKARFLEIVEISLKRNLIQYPKEYVDHQIREYKRIFDGSMEPSYGTKFDKYFRKTQDIKQNNFKELNLEETKKTLEKSKVLLEEVEEIDLFITNLGILTNKLIVVFLTSHLIKDSVLNGKLISECKKSIDSFGKISYKEVRKKLNSEISTLEKDLFKTNEFLEKIGNEAIKRTEIVDEELNKELLFTKKVLTFYNDIIFEDEEILLLDEESFIKPVEKSYLKEVLSNFIQYINRSISLMSNIERKLRMKRLLSIMEFPFESPEDFMDYIKNSLDQRTTSNNEILIAINSLYYLMDMKK